MEPNLDRDDSFLNQASEFWLYAIGRLQPGTDPVQVQAKVKTEIQQWLSDQNGNSERVRLYGVAAYTVVRRTGEIGLHMAIGANSKQLVGMVLRSAMARQARVLVAAAGP